MSITSLSGGGTVSTLPSDLPVKRLFIIHSWGNFEYLQVSNATAGKI
jgi:hypothetical protein